MIEFCQCCSSILPNRSTYGVAEGLLQLFSTFPGSKVQKAEHKPLSSLSWLLCALQGSADEPSTPRCPNRFKALTRLPSAQICLATWVYLASVNIFWMEESKIKDENGESTSCWSKPRKRGNSEIGLLFLSPVIDLRWEQFFHSQSI